MVITISTSWSTSYQAFFKGSISVSSADPAATRLAEIAEIGGVSHLLRTSATRGALDPAIAYDEKPALLQEAPGRQLRMPHSVPSGRGLRFERQGEQAARSLSTTSL